MLPIKPIAWRKRASAAQVASDPVDLTESPALRSLLLGLSAASLERQAIVNACDRIAHATEHLVHLATPCVEQVNLS